MNNIGKALKGGLDVPHIMTQLQKAIKKYRPKMTEEEKGRRRRKENFEWYKKNRDYHGFTVYYDRNRKGWFYRDVLGNRYGFRGSKDRGFDSRDKAISAIRRRWKKVQKTSDDNARVEKPILEYDKPLFIEQLHWKPTGEDLRSAFYKSMRIDSSTAIYWAFRLDKMRTNAIFELVGKTRAWFLNEHGDGLKIQDFIDYLGLHIIYNKDGISLGALDDSDYEMYQQAIQKVEEEK